MNFYIKHIRLWFGKNFPPITYDFLPDKVNVITGDSSTGKSSVLRIIDYCLLSDTSNIVEDVINENVEWYGLSFSLEEKDYVIVRKAPNNEVQDKTIYFADGEDFPEKIVPNTERAKLLPIFNNMFHCPDKQIATKKEKIRLDFRCFLLLSYLTEDIIATMGNYFDTNFFDNSKMAFILDDVIKIALGVDDEQEIVLKRKLAQLQRKLDNNEKNIPKDRANYERYENELKVLKDRAIALGVVENSLWDDPQTLIDIIKKTIKRYNELFKDDKWIEENDKLKNELYTLKRKKMSYDSLKKNYHKYIDNAKQIEDSLLPIEYLKAHMSDVALFDETKILFDSLASSLKEIKKTAVKPIELPAGFAQRYKMLIEQIDKLREKIRKISKVSKKTNDFNWVYEYVILQRDFENLKLPIKRQLSLEDLIRLKEDIKLIDSKLQRVIKNTDEILTRLNGKILRYYQLQHGMSDSYNACVPQFDIDKKVLMLKSPNSSFLLKNIGSKSNYMFLHLCFFLGLHEQLFENRNDFVPNFLFIDQPSIPYYADKTESNNLKNDDKLKLGYAFILIDGFMNRQKDFLHRHFQIILIEHADSSYWEKLKSFDTRYRFTHAEGGLIPRYVQYPTL